MHFDPKSAAAACTEKSTDELIRMAFLEPDYVQEAKEIARAELANRGLKVTAQDIEQARLRLKEQKKEAFEYSTRNVESDEDMANWRRRLRARLAPHRKLLSFIALPLMSLALLNSFFEWGLLHLHGRRSEGVALLVGLLFHVFVGPSREDLAAQSDNSK